MVLPLEQQLGPITILDKDESGTVTVSGANITEVYGVIHNGNASAPATEAGEGTFWVENTEPTLPKFTNSEGVTITLGAGGGLSQILSIDNYTDGYNINLNLGSAIVSSDGEVLVDDDLHITGKLTVDGLIDPTGLVLNDQAVSPTTPTSGYGTIWTAEPDSGFTNNSLRYISNETNMSDSLSYEYYNDGYTPIFTTKKLYLHAFGLVTDIKTFTLPKIINGIDPADLYFEAYARASMVVNITVSTTQGVGSGDIGLSKCIMQYVPVPNGWEESGSLKHLITPAVNITATTSSGFPIITATGNEETGNIRYMLDIELTIMGII